MRIAIVHYWLTGMRGGERVIEELCKIYPTADIFTHVYDPQEISSTIASHKIFTSFINRIPFAKRKYKAYLPLMPLALEHLDLRGYDLIISSESGPAKGIVPPPQALHVCYCHSPMRYIWNMYHDYRTKLNWLKRAIALPMSHYVRTWDAVSATRVHHFVANSYCVADRLSTYYHRPSEVIYPPVSTELFHPVEPEELGDFYLMVGELVPYKRADLAVEAFNRLGRKLIVIGGGEMLPAIRALAGPNVTVLGRQNLAQLQWHYARCRALIFPGEDDFGIVPVEAMASGRPIVAFNRGGAMETVVDGVTGTFFDEQTPDAIIEAVLRSEAIDWDSAAIVAHAFQFDSSRFRSRFSAYIDERLAAHRARPRTLFRNPAPVPPKRQNDEAAERVRSGLTTAPARITFQTLQGQFGAVLRRFSKVANGQLNRVFSKLLPPVASCATQPRCEDVDLRWAATSLHLKSRIKHKT
jgi:glycosyltransferase involved in cell wall biosynthesis